MSCEGCPLEPLCVRRLEVAREQIDELRKVTRQFYGAAHHDYAEHAGNVSIALALATVGETWTQSDEQHDCKKPKKIRSRGIFGEVVDVRCGNPDRIKRLQGGSLLLSLPGMDVRLALTLEPGTLIVPENEDRVVLALEAAADMQENT